MKYDAIIIGGGPAGMTCALTSGKYYPDKNILVIKEQEKGIIPCGIPYMFKTLKIPEENEVSCSNMKPKNISVMVDEVIDIDPILKKIKTINGKIIEFDKLVLATGSRPTIPKIDGIGKYGIYPIKKDFNYIKKLIPKIKKAKDIVIIGGGFIGLELADEISEFRGKKITIIEFMSEILINSFDSEFSALIKEELQKKKINLLLSKKALRFTGNKIVKSVILSENTEIKSDIILLGTGFSPNTSMLDKDKFALNISGTVKVDKYMRTQKYKDIFAIGDCAEKKDYFTKKITNVMLASIAASEARIAGINLFKKKSQLSEDGTISIYSTKIGDTVFGSAGIIEKRAIDEKLNIIVGKSEVMDRHPGSLNGSHLIKMKLIFLKESEVLIGGQVSGGISVGELINLIGLAIQRKMTRSELEILQVATHPKLTSSPTMYPVILAAQDASNK